MPPIFTNSLRPCGPDLLQSLWKHYAQIMFGFSLDENGLDFSTHNPASSKLSSTSGPKTKSPMHLRRQDLVYIELITFSLTISPQSTELGSHYSQIRLGSGFFSQNITILSIQPFNAQSHNPCTNQFSQLEQPSCFSNPSRMDENNHPGPSVSSSAY